MSKKPTKKKAGSRKKARKVRRLVEYPEPLLEWLDEFAAEHHMSRNQLIINVLTGFRHGVESEDEGPDLGEQMELLRTDIVDALERRLSEYGPQAIRRKAGGKR